MNNVNVIWRHFKNCFQLLKSNGSGVGIWGTQHLKIWRIGTGTIKINSWDKTKEG